MFRTTKGLKTIVSTASLLLLGACTVTTTTDKDGKVSRSYSFGSSQPRQDDLFAKVSDHQPHIGKLKKYDSIHYFSGFGDHKASIATIDNTVTASENDKKKVELDFSLKANFNSQPGERYLLSILVEKTTFPHVVEVSDDFLLTMGSSKHAFKPNYISDFFKSSSQSVKRNGSESFQKEVRDFIAINFNLDRQLLEQILQSRDTGFELMLSDGTTISGKLTKKNYEIFKEFSKALKETSSSDDSL